MRFNAAITSYFLLLRLLNLHLLSIVVVVVVVVVIITIFIFDSGFALFVDEFFQLLQHIDLHQWYLLVVYLAKWLIGR